MKSRNRVKKEIEISSILALSIVLVAEVILTAVCVEFEQNLIAVILIFAFCLGLIGRIWTRAVEKNLSVLVKSDKSHLFPGEKTEISFEVNNKKSFPVSYVDIAFPLRKPIAMLPKDNILRNMSKDEKILRRIDENEDTKMYEARCSSIPMNSKLTLNTLWEASERGILPLKEMEFRTGDSFGMSKIRVDVDKASKKEFVIYPRLVPVDIGSFVRNIWEGQAGRKGALEDVSLIKSTRGYMDGDSEKKLNFRVLARTGEMVVNDYEKISPKSVHFIFDGESFNSVEDKKEKELEESLSILASILLSLDEWGMDAGFSFPKTDRLPAVNISGNKERIPEILYRMAEYRLRMPVIKERENGKPIYEVEDSIFSMDELLSRSFTNGRIYFVTFDEESKKKATLLKMLSNEKIEVLTYLDLLKFKRGGLKNE